jgi:translocation and assembly module TamB
LALDVVPPAQPSPGDLPLNARLRAAYDASSDALDVPEFVAVTRATQVRASGTLSSHAAARFSITTTDLDEWRPFLSALRESERLPVAIHGRASFNGTATGKLSSLLISGNLQAQDFDSELPATASLPQRQVHWDYLSADVQLSPRAVAMRNGVLRHGPSLINFDFSAPLTKGQLAETSPFTAHLNIRNGNLAEIAELAGYNHPVSGTLDLSVHAGGTRASPNGEGHLQLSNAVIFGEPVQHLTSDIRFAGGEAELNNLQLTRDNARITGGATISLASGEFRFNINGSNFDLLRIPQLQATRVRVEGRMDFVAQGSGTLQAPSVNARFHVHDLTLDRERSGDFELSVVTKGADMQVTGRSQFKEADLTIDGTIHAREDWPADINLHFNHLDVDSLLRVYLHGRITGHSAAAGDVELHGPLLKPHELNVVGNLSDFFADVENVPIRNDGPIRFSLTTEAVNLQQLHLIGEGTDLAGAGSMQLKGDRQVDFHARGRVNLHLIESFNPDFTSSGFITVNMAVGGTMAQPTIEGSLQVSHGNIAYIDLPSALSDINGSLLFSHGRLQVQTLTAHTGGGLVSFGGYATVNQRQLNFDLTVQGQDVRLRYPPGVSSTATADLRWVGTPAASTLSGDITVSKLAMTTGFDFGAYLERAAQNSSLPQTNPLLNQIKLDVHIVTTPELQMQTAVVRLSGDADLRLRGTAGKPVLLGRADIIEGDVFFNGTKYRLERGDVTFTNPVSTTPVLDLQAATRVRDYDITLNLNGDLSKLNLTYRSEPPLPEADILALLALGRTQEESAQLQQNNQAFSQETSNAILAEALNATLSNRVQRIFGVSRIKVAPQGSTTETSLVRGPQVTIEQQVTSSLTLTYSTNVSQTSQQIIQVEYNLTRNVSVVGVRDQNGVVSFDVRIRQRKK